MAIPDFSNARLSQAERDKVEEILRELVNSGHSQAYEELLKLHYEEIPVSIDEFIDNPEYLGHTTNNGKSVYPYWRKTLNEIFHGGKSYAEIIFAGAIGLGKSWNGDIIGCYLLYKLLCLKNPQAYYNLAANAPITFAFFNIHKYLAGGVAYGQFQKMLQESPWFLKHGEIRGIKNREYYPDKGINFIVGANPEHAIGQNIFFGMLDEMSFAKKPNADILKAGVMELYRSVKTRMTSRFTRDGILQAKMILISSKRTDSDFLDQYAQRQKNDPDTYIVDEPQWVVKPKGTFADETFRLAVGSKAKKSMIILDSDERPDEEFLVDGYTQILNVPVDLKPRFEFDMDANLRDLAGVSTTIFTKFIAYDKLVRCYHSRLSNPFENAEPVIGLNDSLTLMDFFDLSKVPQWVTELPMYIHCDIALTGDGYGMGCVASAGTKTHWSIQSGQQVTDPVYVHVFTVRIRAPQGDQISLEKARNFIYWLKFTHGWNIKRTSFDGFNSADSRQSMITRGIPSDLISLDRAPCNGYLTTRLAIYEKRVAMLNVPILEDELVNLERNEMSGKVDHPPEGSKDAADGLAGALYNASMHQSEFSSISKSAEIFLGANESASDTQSIQAELEAQLMDIAKKHANDEQDYVITDDDDMDTIVQKVTGVVENSDDDSGEISDEMKLYYALNAGIIL